MLGISFDTPAENRSFREKFNFPFPLLCDTDRRVGMALGACDSTSAANARRIAYLIDEDGKVQHAWDKVDTAEHANQVVALI